MTTKASRRSTESRRRHTGALETDDFRELAGDRRRRSREQMPEELPVDSAWDDVFQATTPTQTGADDDFDGTERNTTEESLQDHLLWQLNLTPMSQRDLAIARAIIDGIDNDGMLIATLEEILSGFPVEYEIEADEVVAVLKRIQQFDPPGVAARDLRECLLIQLNQLARRYRLAAGSARASSPTISTCSRHTTCRR